MDASGFSKMVLKKGDFIEIEYVGYDKESGKIFDLTSADVAKKEGILDPKASYGPIILCIGERFVVKGLDEFLPGKEEGNEYDVEIPPEQGFGKRDSKLMKLVSVEIFRKENIRPFPELRVNVDGLLGVVRSVSGGRIIVDFNHPLAGHHLLYKIKIIKTIKEKQKQLEWVLSRFSDKLKVVIKGGKAEIRGEVSDDLKKALSEYIKKLIVGIKEVNFTNTPTER